MIARRQPRAPQTPMTLRIIRQVQQLRAENLTQSEIAVRLRISQGSVSRILCGRVRPRSESGRR